MADNKNQNQNQDKGMSQGGKQPPQPTKQGGQGQKEIEREDINVGNQNKVDKDENLDGAIDVEGLIEDGISLDALDVVEDVPIEDPVEEPET